MSGIKRNLPNNEYEAAVGANAPSKTNVYATMLDVGSAGVFGISDATGTYTYYDTLTLAMAAAVTGQTIEMFADVIETGAVTITLKDGVNINGNGHTYTLDTATTTTGFIDGAVSIEIKLSNITLVRKGAGAGIMLGLSASGNRIIANSTFIKIESNSSTGIGTYSGSDSGNITGFTVNCTGTSCTGINLTRGYIDNCSAVSTGNGIRIVIGNIINSYGESTGAGDGIGAFNSGYVSNCSGKSNTGYGIYTYIPTYNSTGYSSGNIGIRFNTALMSNCTGTSSSTYGIYGSGGTLSNCNAISSGGGALFIQNGIANNCTAYSTVNIAMNVYNDTRVNNCTFTTLSGGTVLSTSSASIGASIKNCTVINKWDNAVAHGIPANPNLSIMNCAIKVTNALANCLSSSIAYTMKYANNSFEGATTPISANITQGIVNTQDNQGNILI